LLKKTGPQEWIFNEIKALDEMSFRYKDKETPLGYVTSLSHALQSYPVEEALYAPYKMKEFDRDLIQMIVDKLCPSNVHVKRTSKSFKGKTNHVEKWYKTEYNLYDISPEKIKAWEECGLNEELKMPTPNELIPTEFDIKAKPEDELSDVPEMLLDNNLFRVWFKQDKKFCLPKACINIEFSSPITSIHPRHCALGDIYLHLLKDSLTEFTYDAELAGISYRTDLHFHGIHLKIKGYNSKQIVLLRKIVERMVTLELTEDRFNVVKERIKRDLKNFEAAQPHSHAMFYMSYLLSEHAWEKSEILDALTDISLEKLRQFLPDFLGQMYIECLIAGNVTKEEAMGIVNMVENMMKDNAKTKPLLPIQRIRSREIQLPDGACYVFQRKHAVQSNSSIEIYFQTEMQCTRSNVLLELFAQMISDKCFDQLRTQEQLGYVVFSGIRRANSVQGLRFIIQSEKDPKILDERIEAFLKTTKEMIENFSEKEFENHVNALIMKKLEEPKKLVDECRKYWQEIMSKQYNFRRPTIEADELRKIKKGDILRFYESLLSSSAPHRHKISVYILGNGLPTERKLAEKEEEKEDAPTFITDLLQFKSSLPLFPVSKYDTGLHLELKAKAKL